MSATPAALPLLIVVTGRAGSGKTTLAHALGPLVRCPVISRDECKEGYVLTTGRAGTVGDEIARDVADAFFDTLYLLLKRQISLIAEAAFQHKVWGPRLENLKPLARVRIILCAVEPALARARHIARADADPDRERFHDDPTLRAVRQGDDPPIGEWDPPHSDVPTLTVDTSSDYRPSLQEIAAFATVT